MDYTKISNNGTYQTSPLDDYDFLTTKDVINNEDLQNDILSILRKYKLDSENFSTNKRNVFKQYYKDFLQPSLGLPETRRVKLFLAFQQMKAFIALQYKAEYRAEFDGVDDGDDDIAYKLDMLANHDYRIMGKAYKDFLHFQHLFFYGVAIRVRNYRDKSKATVSYLQVNPEYWLCDPTANPIDNDYEYHGFLMTTTINRMIRANKKNDIYFNLDKITASFASQFDTKRYQATDRLLSYVEGRRLDLQIINRYVEINCQKYMCTTDSSCGTLLRFEPLKTINKKEKDDSTLINFPVAISHVFPLENDPRGASPMELIVDKERATNELFNLTMQKERHNAGFKRIFVDSDIVANADLMKEVPEKGPIIIPVTIDETTGKNINNAMSQSDDFQDTGSSQQMMSALQNMIYNQTSITPQTMGLSGGEGTLGQSQIQQLNSNLIFGLDTQVIQLGEERFWKDIWYRSVLENLKASDKKATRVGSGSMSSYVFITSDDVDKGQSFDIRVYSKTIRDEENKQLLNYMVAREPMIMQDPNISKTVKLMYRREMDRLQGVPKDQIMKIHPLSPNEHYAIKYKRIIDAGIAPQNMLDSNIDLSTLYYYIGLAKDSDIKARAIDEIVGLMIKQGIDVEQQSSAMSGIANSMGSQMTSKMLSENEQTQIGAQPMA